MSIFLSYRRADSAAVTRTIYDGLVGRYGAATVFKDVDSIPVGVDFRRHIAEALASCRVVVAVIGPGWLDARDDAGRRRLDDPGDFVRLEIETALNLHIPVVPLLIDGAAVPRSDDLPPTLRPLSFQNGARLRTGPELAEDLQRLVEAIEPHLPKEAAEAGPRTSWWQRLLAPWRWVVGRPGPTDTGRACPYCGGNLVLTDDPDDPTMLRCSATARSSAGQRCTFRLLRRWQSLRLNLSVIGTHNSLKDIWLLEVWARLLVGATVASARCAVVRTGEEKRQLEELRQRQGGRETGVVWHHVTSDAVLIEGVVPSRRQRPFLVGLLNYPQGELAHDTMQHVMRKHALASQGLILFLNGAELARGGDAVYRVTMYLQHLAEDFRATGGSQARPLAVCLGWSEDGDRADAASPELLEAFRALARRPLTLQTLQEGERLALEQAPTTNRLIDFWRSMPAPKGSNAVALFPIILRRPSVSQPAALVEDDFLGRLFDPVAWQLHMYGRLRLPER